MWLNFAYGMKAARLCAPPLRQALRPIKGGVEGSRRPMMRTFAAALFAAAALATTAVAQTETPAVPTPPAAPVPASSCAAPAAAPAAPTGRLNANQMQARVAEYEAWRTATQTALACRADEVRSLQAQTEARLAEYRAAVAAGQASGAEWQASLDAHNARNRR